MSGLMVRSSLIASEAVGENLLLVDAQRDLFFSSNGVAAIIWERLKDRASHDDLYKAVMKHFENVDAEIVKKDVNEFVESLIENGLVEKL